MTRRVDHVETVSPTIARTVRQRHALRLDRDPALALKRHRVQHLRLHLPGRKAAALLDESIGKRGFAVIDVRDDGKVPDEFLLPTTHERAVCRGTKKGAV